MIALARITQWLGSPRRRVGTTVFALVSGAFALAPVFNTSSEWPTAVATRHTFVETLVETGTVNAARLTLYGAPLGAGPSKIVAIAGEGSAVQPGDVLVSFDVSATEAALRKEEIGGAEAQAALEQAREALRLVTLEGAGAIEEATLEADAAERRAVNERDGLGQLSLEEARTAEEEARREEARTRAAHEDIAALLAEGFVTRAEVERADQAHLRAVEMLRLATLKRDLLARFDRPAAIARASAEQRAATRAVAQARERASARVAQQQAVVAAASAAVQAAEGRIDVLRERLAQSVVRAQTAGLVIHRELFFGSDKRKPQVGDEVWPNQPLVSLPASDSFIVEADVREIDLHKIRPGQLAHVTLDAYPDLQLRGEVASIGAVARDDPASVGIKRFPLSVRLLASDTRLRSGMTARLDVEVRAIANALVVPAEAVFDEDGSSYCVVSRNGQPLRRMVRLAGRNATEVAVASGIAEGETVYRGDPTVTVDVGKP